MLPCMGRHIRTFLPTGGDAGGKEHHSQLHARVWLPLVLCQLVVVLRWQVLPQERHPTKVVHCGRDDSSWHGCRLINHISMITN